MACLLLRLLLFLGILHLACCSRIPSTPPLEKIEPPPTPILRHLSPDSLPPLLDDFDRASLQTAASRQLAAMLRLDAQGVMSFGNEASSMHRIIVSLQKLLEKLREHPSREQLQNFLVDNYHVYQVLGGKGASFDEMLATGYYQPLFSGCLSPSPTCNVPIYATPPSLVSIDPKDSRKGMARRDPDSRLLPFWSRADIEANPTLFQGSELAYLADPFEAFLLQIQGSGRIRLPDQSIRTLAFAASNGHDYKSIGKLLVDEGKLSLEEATIPGIRAYLDQHPEEFRRILNHNPRYVFFRWGNDAGPRGSLGEILTPGRSVAVDQDIFPMGPFAFLSTNLPSDHGTTQPFHRLVFPQDTGAAIKGPGRIDIFFGGDQAAEEIAQRMKQPARLYYLLWKDWERLP